jgi:hypothetical protein
MSEEHKKLYNFFLSGAKISSNRKPESLEKEIRYSLALMENVKLVSGDSLQWVTRRTVDGVNYVITKRAREYEEDGISISPKPEYFIAIEAPEKEVEKEEPVEKEEIKKRLEELEREGWLLAPAFCIVDPSPDFDKYQNLNECDLLICAPGGFEVIVAHVKGESIPWAENDISLERPFMLRRIEVGTDTEERVVGLKMTSAFHEFTVNDEREDIIEDMGWDPGPIPYMGYDNANPHLDYYLAAAAEFGAIPGSGTWTPGYCDAYFALPGGTYPEHYKATRLVTEYHDQCNYSFVTDTRMKFGNYGMLPSKHLFADYTAVGYKEHVKRSGVWAMGLCIGSYTCLDHFIDYWKEERYPDVQTRQKIHTGLYRYTLSNDDGTIVYDESQMSYEREMNFKAVRPMLSENTFQHDIERNYGNYFYEMPLYNHNTSNSGGIVEKKFGEHEEGEIFFYLYTELHPDLESHRRCNPWKMEGASWGYDKNGNFYNGDNSLCGENYELVRQRQTFKLWANVMGDRVFLDEVELTDENYYDEWYWYDAGCCGVYDFFGLPIFVYAYRLNRAYYTPSYGTEVLKTKYGYFIGSYENHIQSEDFLPLGILDDAGAGTQWHDIDGCVEKHGLYGSGIATIVAYNFKIKETLKF